jgi:hypothetical protein
MAAYLYLINEPYRASLNAWISPRGTILTSMRPVDRWGVCAWRRGTRIAHLERGDTVRCGHWSIEHFAEEVTFAPDWAFSHIGDIADDFLLEIRKPSELIEFDKANFVGRLMVMGSEECAPCLTAAIGKAWHQIGRRNALLNKAIVI